MGWFSKIAQPLVRDLSIAAVAAVRRPRPRPRRPRSELRQPARLLHPRAEAGRARRRSRPGRPGQPLRRDRGRLRHRSRATELIQAKGFPTRSRPAGRSGAGRPLSRRPLRHAAPDLQHVPPLPRAPTTAGRAGHLHLGRHLEHQPHRLKRVEQAVLQERAGVVQTRLTRRRSLLTLVPVASILVASIRFHFLDVLLHLRYRGPHVDRLRRAAFQGRGDGLVRAGLDHHRVRAGRLRAVRRHRARDSRDPDGPAAAAPALQRRSDALASASASGGACRAGRSGSAVG